MTETCSKKTTPNILNIAVLIQFIVICYFRIL